MGDGLNSYFVKESTQLVTRQVKSCAIVLIIRGMQVEHIQI